MSDEIDLTIKATNGEPWTTRRFTEHSNVAEVLKESVRHFEEEHVMTKGDYMLSLVRDGQAEPLVDSQSLERAGVRNGATLVITVRGPQVDG
jgi:hypothetical protein